MEENRQDQPPRQREFRGLYRHVKISVKTLDFIIIGCIVVIIVFMFIGLRNPGFTITFDTKGGTDVPAHIQMYGETLELPEAPSRQGYEFTGWYRDPSCAEAWNQQEDTVCADVTLYAGWEKSE
jgi:uncharacterized repeat protein (TIGR02543 family)